jgi:hypothetical protein
LTLPSAAQVAAARDHIRPFALRTPLLRLNADLPAAVVVPDGAAETKSPF